MTSPPVVVGRYRLDELFRPEVDTSTWKASDLTARRPVLVCLCAGETGAAARSRRATVHPGLVPVLDVIRLRDGVEPPLPSPDPRGEIFVVQEAPEGEPLDRVRLGRGVEPPESVRVTLAVANALAAVHSKGSVHGGVCPAAIELRSMEDGGPRLGLRGIGDASLAYASPSRLCDGGPSLHDDAWGLLGVLYFLLTGSPPFSAETPQALARRVLGGRPIPIKMAGPADAELQKIFDRGFSRTASQRFPDVASVRDELRGWLSRFGTAALAEQADENPDTLPPARDAMRSAPTRELPSAAASDRAETLSWRPTPGVIEQAIAAEQKSSARRTMPFAGAPAPEGELEPLLARSSVGAPGAVPISAPAPSRETEPPPVGAATTNPPVASGSLPPAQTRPTAPAAASPPASTPPPPAAPSSPPSDASGPATPAETPSARAGEETPSRQRSSRPDVLYTAPRSATPPSRRALPPTDETVRFSREQLQLLEQERDESAPLDVHVSEANVAVAKAVDEREETTEPSIDVNALMRAQSPAPAKEARPAVPAVSAPLPTERSAPTGRTMLLGFLGGVAVAVAIGGAFAWLRQGQSSAGTPRAGSAPTPSQDARPKETTSSSMVSPPAVSSLPPADTRPSATPPPAVSTTTSPAPTRVAGAAGDTGACVRGAYADATFADDAELSFVCDERSARRTAQRLHRAIVAGGKGRAVTDAMREWSQLRWFELPAILSLRERCCPAAPTDLPSISPACPSAQATIGALATAARAGSDLDGPVRDYRRLVTCLVSTGDASAFGQDGPMTGGEDTTFRAFAARVRR